MLKCVLKLWPSQTEEKAKLVCQPDGFYGPITDREVAVRSPPFLTSQTAGGRDALGQAGCRQRQLCSSQLSSSPSHPFITFDRLEVA